MAKLLLITLLTLGLAACGPADEPPSDPLQVNNAWVRNPPPGRTMTAAYAELHNRGSETLRIASYSSPQFASVSLHETRVDEAGMSSMEEIHELSIAPGETVVLEPGGKHLMLMGRDPEVPLESVEIRFNDQPPVRFQLR